VLAATFGALAVLPLVVLVQVGVLVAAGVLLDTFVVRSLVVPAAVELLGERTWWPSAPARRRSDPDGDHGPDGDGAPEHGPLPDPATASAR
jgi:RND superfamily putative drug exporter